jgi:hypothetical protein
VTGWGARSAARQSACVAGLGNSGCSPMAPRGCRPLGVGVSRDARGTADGWHRCRPLPTVASIHPAIRTGANGSWGVQPGEQGRGWVTAQWCSLDDAGFAHEVRVTGATASGLTRPSALSALSSLARNRGRFEDSS